MKDFFINKSIRGSMIISKEGINGTISAKKKNLDLTIKKVKKTFKFNKFDSINLSKCNYQPFHRGKVKIKKEVVPMGVKVKKRKLKKLLKLINLIARIYLSVNINHFIELKLKLKMKLFQ